MHRRSFMAATVGLAVLPSVALSKPLDIPTRALQAGYDVLVMWEKDKWYYARQQATYNNTIAGYIMLHGSSKYEDGRFVGYGFNMASPYSSMPTYMRVAKSILYSAHTIFSMEQGEWKCVKSRNGEFT